MGAVLLVVGALLVLVAPVPLLRAAQTGRVRPWRGLLLALLAVGGLLSLVGLALLDG
ncbi:hypothetical protein FB554_2669 [Barrientosiimonas humi]|uniref:Uncharacterized protein n=2 Tax=Barrientosiimonas TaxID=1535207 RepID=A0A542XF91_9MICO|nr:MULTISPECIES: hypothetical protein [Barrientosiimonas]TQL34494.1 hypothetical protein FB554_2669 [Barrientosiimonas humi]CAG7574483.1 hypothetical protein BH39T_PBIAJDOK_03139 [Barrientosiimonas humi]